jgi:DNA-binding MarR family transcriptional regulator
MRDDPEAGVVQWAKTTRCDKSAVSMRLGRLAKRGLVERDGNGRWWLAGVNPTVPPSL